ncbi:hypothetical protein NLU13_9909 [Sarocladium strictum]|uniref:Uncharacterized protein n=1 Tax=Sarocladium strictum TaxID=5046 RepID=A0AA39G9D2_SARSR|nr:hypothetical protein NLU13_9909 [Sarocladium strictum]
MPCTSLHATCTLSMNNGPLSHDNINNQHHHIYSAASLQKTAQQQRSNKRKPGATFAFKPSNTIASTYDPNFETLATGSSSLQSPESSRTSSQYTASHHDRLTTNMVNERAPPAGEARNKPSTDAPSQRRREASPDSDTDITSVINGFASLKSKVQETVLGGPSSSSNHRGPLNNHRPAFGHPSKMVSSLKQKANIFIHQKSHPEWHRDTSSGSHGSSGSYANNNAPTLVSTPRAPKYQDRRAPPPEFFSSTSTIPFQPTRGRAGGGADEVFYTDPDKASADLKALLEGGMESDDEEEEGTTSKDGSTKPEAGKEEVKPVSKDKVAKDGTVNGLKVKLLPHQVEGVEWMRGRELGPVKRGKVPKGGILADDMGLGKTLQTVSLILTQQKPAKDDKAWKKQFERVEKTTLVVAPLALIRQWEAEIKEKVEKSHGLKVLVHHGPQRTKNFKDLALYDVVITTFQILVSEHGACNDSVKAGCFGLHWWRVVLDEAHTIKNRNAKMTKACYALRSEYRWCLTGTPMQNNLDELQSLVRFLQIKPYDDIREWKDQIDRPFKEGKGHIAIRRLHSLLRCFMKRRTKAILKEDGALNPGGKPSAKGEGSTTGFKVTERKVVTVAATLPPAERAFYNRLEARANDNIKDIMAGNQKYTHAFTLLLRLRQACNHPKLVAGKLDKDAMSTGPGNASASQKSQQDASVDAVADLFGGMSIEAKHCTVCARILDAKNTGGGDMCSDCLADLEVFNGETPKRKKSSRRKSHVKKVERKTLKAQRRVKNRRAVVDSDDEEEEGSWLVPEGERGSLKLGKAGGEEDENAEGGGEWIGKDDSDEEGYSRDQKDLSGFVVDDDAAKKDKGYRSPGEESEDDSLLSISAITKQMASQTLNDKPVTSSQASASDASFSSSTDSDGVDASSIRHSSDSEAEGDDIDRYTHPGTRVLASAKIQELLRLLRAEAAQHKFIVFSQFTTMLDLIEPFVRREGLKFARYDGSMRNDEREESLRRLRKEEGCRVLLCSLKCGSLGLNLTAATRVVIVEPFWNPFVEEQAIDRVHRLTQTVDVIVYKLTVTQTVEERILELQEKKRLLAEQAIEGAGIGKGGANKDALKLGLKDIIDLFRPTAVEMYGEGSTVGDERSSTVQGNNGRRSEGRKGMGMSGGVRREESATYGRRW